MTSDPKAMVQKLWDFCDVLRDDGLSYGDYLEQLTYLLFLKMADEQEELLGERVVPVGFDWQTLLNRSGEQRESNITPARTSRDTQTLQPYQGGSSEWEDPTPCRCLHQRLQKTGQDLPVQSSGWKAIGRVPVRSRLVYHWCMARTNIDIDDEACELVMRQYGLRTKREAVNLALRMAAIEPMSLEEALAMQGTGWEGDLDQMRTTRYP